MTWRDAGLEGPFAGRIEEAVANHDKIFASTYPGLLGIKIVEASPGHAIATVDITKDLLHPGGAVHGGAVASLGDTAAAWATFTAIDDSKTHTTIEFKANFLRGASSGTLTAEATAIHKGRRTMVIDVRITDEQGRLLSIMTVTQAIMSLAEGRPDQATT